MYSKDLVRLGIAEWTASNVTDSGLNYVLGTGAASMYQVRDMSTLDFGLKGFRLEVTFTTSITSEPINDFAYLKINYSSGYDIMQIPLRNSDTVIVDTITRGTIVNVEVGATKNSTGTVTVNIKYYHDDNPFTYDLAEADKPSNSIITDNYGIHIYDGNAFEGGTRRVTLGEYDLNQFGLLIKGANAETVINEYGVNPKFLDYSKNVIWNSSFEVIDAANKPSFWNIIGDGESVSSSSFYGTRSLRLGAGALARQTWAARTKPWWLGNPIIRVSLYARGVQNIKVRVVDIGLWEDTGGIFVGYYLLTDENGNNGTTGIGDGGGGSELTFTGSTDWEDSRIVFTFDSNQYPSSQVGFDITAFALEIENIDTGDIYIDGIMAHVDFTGQWAQLYKDGPRSISTQMLGDIWTNPDPLEGSEAAQTAVVGVHVGPTPPTNTNLLWLDTTT